MKKFNIYYQVTVVCAISLGVLVVLQLLFVLLPLYDLVGKDIVNADDLLNTAERRANILNILMVATTLVMVGASLIGAKKNSIKKKRHAAK
jgi:hypothetical protein